MSESPEKCGLQAGLQEVTVLQHTLYKFADGNNFKMTPNLHLHIFTEMRWEENVLQ